MPSYYDSKKNKPGKARVKYEKGGKVKGKEEELTASQNIEKAVQKAERMGMSAQEIEEYKKKYLNLNVKNPKLARKIHNIINEPTPLAEALQEVKDKEWRKKVGKEPTTATEMGRYAKGGKVKKMAKGGKFEVRGQGAATRGGNFSRNG